MTTTGPTDASATFGFRSVAGTVIGARVPFVSSAAIADTVAAMFTLRPVTDGVTTGLKLRKSRRESTGLRSKREATRSTNAFTSGRLTSARNPSVVPGPTVRAFATAESAETVVPSRSGVTLIFVLSSRSTIGRLNDVRTACTARSDVRPPTGTPPRVTPSAITVAGAVVVGVVSVGTVTGGVSARTDAARPPAASRTSTIVVASRRVTVLGARGKDPGIVDDDTVDTAFDQGSCERRLVHGPDIYRGAGGVTHGDRGGRDDGPVEGRRLRRGAREEARQPAGPGPPPHCENRPHRGAGEPAPGGPPPVPPGGERARGRRRGRGGTAREQEA